MQIFVSSFFYYGGTGDDTPSGGMGIQHGDTGARRGFSTEARRRGGAQRNNRTEECFF